jgi:hypothetical protein
MALKLPRLSPGLKIINRDGTPSALFIQWWQQNADNIERSVNGIVLALEAAGIALDAADVALAAAAAAQDAADGTTAESSLVNSYIANFTAPLITADNLGNVTIANHDRVYGDPVMNPTVSVVGGVIATGVVSGGVVRVFYDDPTRTGGAVAYQFTVDPASPPVQTGDRHSVGAATIPVAGTEDGNYVRPPGFVEAPV